MIGYRLSKYNPTYRTKDGAFSIAEWTSVLDVGKKVANKVFTKQEYVRVEDAYVESVRRFCEAAGVRTMNLEALQIDGYDQVRIVDLGRDLPDPMKFTDGMEVSGWMLESAVRLTLQERMSCRLESSKLFYIHFGFDFYIYTCLPSGTLPPDLPPGMFSELCESPFLLDKS